MSSTSIHSTAIIASSVQLGDNVTVGPYACLDGETIIGDNCVIQAHAIITGRTTLGAGNKVGYGAVIGADPQDLSYTPELNSRVEIGENNTLREYATVHRAATQDGVTRIGNACFLMGCAHVGHDSQIADDVIIANNSMLGGHVHVGDKAFIGGGAAIHQFVHIGRVAMLQGHTGLSKNVPPFTLAAGRNGVNGLNTVGMRRAGLSPADRKEVKQAYQLIYLSGFNVSDALKKSEESEWGPHAQGYFDFVRASAKRGIAPLRSVARSGHEE